MSVDHRFDSLYVRIILGNTWDSRNNVTRHVVLGEHDLVTQYCHETYDKIQDGFECCLYI